ncbi:hypothetical protein G6F58_012864 [Rhizopus delemar]|nr:hypothetical protein G6F58_012864 [Rhizopus delemar]
MSRPLTRIESVIQPVRTRISARVDGPGSRLPSVRAQAAAMGVSVSTVWPGRTAGAGRDGAAAGSRGGPAVGIEAIAGNARGPPQAGLRLDAQRLAVPGRHASWPAPAGTCRCIAAGRLRRPARSARIAPVAAAARCCTGHRRADGTDPADRIGHARGRPDLPLPAQARRLRAGG